jgi:hypothetical protein
MVWTLSRALGPAKDNIYALEFLEGVYSVGLLGAKTEIPDKYDSQLAPRLTLFAAC